jgi:hypothetical protein
VRSEDTGVRLLTTTVKEYVVSSENYSAQLILISIIRTTATSYTVFFDAIAAQGCAFSCTSLDQAGTALTLPPRPTSFPISLAQKIKHPTTHTCPTQDPRSRASTRMCPTHTPQRSDLVGTLAQLARHSTMRPRDLQHSWPLLYMHEYTVPPSDE